MTGVPKDWAVWARVTAGAGPALDRLHAQLVRRRDYAGSDGLVVVEPGGTHTGAPARRARFPYRVMHPTARLLGELAGAPSLRPRLHDPVIHDSELAHELCAVLATLVRRHALPGPDGSARPAGAIAARVMARRGDQVTAPPVQPRGERCSGPAGECGENGGNAR